MPCQHVTLLGGGHAIVCSSRRLQRCACGGVATLLCDWKVPTKRSRTCDRPICTKCSMSPAAGKDLCADHARAFERWRTDRPATAVPAKPVEGVLL